MSIDLYAELGVDKSASADEIKKAYKKLARKYHPDVNKEAGAEDKFKRLQKAYDILSDPQKKSQYDQFGVADDSAGGGGAHGFGGFGGGAGFGGMGGDFEDIFDVFFGGSRGGGRKQGPSRGEDLRYDLEITLEEATTGVDKEIDIYHLETCSHCDGEGEEPGTGVTTCGQCGGAGQVKMTQRTFLGSFSQVTTCPDCQGSGKVIKTPCTQCHGEGVEKRKKTINVSIPGGVSSGVKLRVTGEGNAGEKGGPSGDLYVFITVEEHHYFERDDEDVYIEVMVPFTQLLLGTTATIPTLTGEASLKVPAGTQSGTKFRLKGKGLPNLNGFGKGDQYVIVHADIPQSLSKEEKQLVESLSSVRSDADKSVTKVSRL